MSAPPTPGDPNAELDRLLLALPDPAAVLATFERRLVERGILFGGHPLPTFLRPHLLSRPLFDHWIEETERLFALLERVAVRALEEPGVARSIGFSPSAIDLFRIDPGYRRTVVVARPDAIVQGDRVCFIEVNCDSPAMMTFADELEAILFELPPLAGLAAPLARTPSRTAALLAALRACYAERNGAGAPTIAIIDWPGEKTAGELAKTAELFRALGTEALVAAPAQLRYQGGQLSADGRRIDLAYRRVLCTDFVGRAAELAPLIAAYRDGAVCMANPLRSYLVGTKALLALLHAPENPLGLSPEERALVGRVVPHTELLAAARRPALARTEWVLKKSESYGGQHVVIGPLVDDAEWQGVLARSESGGEWVAQRYAEVPRMRVPELDAQRGSLVLTEKFFNWNPFLFGGRHGGSITRVSDSILINITRGGGLLPTLAA